MKPHVLIPDEIASGIATCGADWGTLDVKQDIAGKKPGRVFCVTSASPGLVVPWGDRDAVDLVLAR